MTWKKTFGRCVGMGMSLMLLCQPGILPRNTVWFTAEAAAAPMDALDFAAALRQMPGAYQKDVVYDTLTYRPDENMLYADDVPVGEEYGDIFAQDGVLYLREEGVHSYLASEQAVPLSSAAENYGYVITEKDDALTVTNAFSTARLIVKASGALDACGAVDAVEGFRDLHIFQYATAADAYAAYQYYLTLPQVEYAEPSVAVKLDENAETVQPAAGNTHASWGAAAMGTDAFIDTYLADGAADEVIVAVLDTGIYYDHSLFENRIVEGGYNFTYTSVEGSALPHDTRGHGTHCAGIICDMTPENVKILPLQVLADGIMTFTEWLYAAILYAVEQNAKVLSMSLGFALSNSPLITEAVQYADAQGVISCVSAGNEAQPVFQYPAAIPEAVTVSAIDSSFRLAGFSNYGAAVDVCAPGVDILSAGLSSETDLVTMSGTSMSAPHVAACCALLLSYDPSLTTTELNALLRENTIDLGEAGFDDEYAAGMVYLGNFGHSQTVCQKAVFSHASGNYALNTQITITTAEENAKIYYTTDGSEPSAENGILYEVPIVLSASMQLKAVVVKDGLSASAVTEAVYTINQQEPSNFLVVTDGYLTAYHGSAAELTIPEVMNGQTITGIGAEAFAGNRQLKRIVLPDTVTEISERAFSGCTALRSISGGQITQIGAGAFAHCKMLYSVSYPMVSRIAADCFSGCISLCYADVSSAAVFEANAFYGCDSLRIIRCQWQNVTEIGAEAFAGCSAWNAILPLPALTQLGEGAFFGDSALEQVMLSEHITALPPESFYDCSALCVFSAPAAVTIGASALAVAQGPSSIGVLDLPFSSVTAVESNAFHGRKLGANGETLCFASLETLQTDSFAGCSVTTLSLPLVAQVPSCAFRDASVTVIELPAAVTLEDDAISGCSYVMLSENCTDAAPRAFDETVWIVIPDAAQLPEAAQAQRMTQAKKLFVTNETASIKQYETVSMGVYYVGYSLEYQWYMATDSGSYEAIPKAVDNVYTRLFETEGQYRFRCVVTDEKGGTYNVYYVIDVEAAPSETLSVQEYVQLNERGSMSRGICVEESGDYRLALESRGNAVLMLLDGEGKVLCRETACAGASAAVVSLQENVCYWLQVTNQGNYDTIVSLEDAAQEPKTFAGLHADYAQSCVLAEGETPALPTLRAADGTLLEQGVDYMLHTVTDGANSRFYVMGLHAYCGVLVLPFMVYTEIETNEGVLLNAETIFTFTPSFTAVYHLYAISDESRLPIDAKGNIYNAAWQPAAFRVSADADGFCASATLYAGETYYFHCEASHYQKSRVYLSRVSHDLCEAVITGTLGHCWDGTLRVPEYTVTLDGRQLVEGVDFTAEYRNHHMPGNAELVIKGMGSYYGSCSQTYQITFDASTVTEAAELVYGEPISVPEAAEGFAVYGLTAQADRSEDNAHIFLHSSPDVRGALYRFDPETEETVSLGDPCNFSALRLEKGIYYLVLGMNSEALKASGCTVTVYHPQSIADAVVAVEQTVFDGAALQPVFTVTLNGEVLVRNTDYTVHIQAGPAASGLGCYRETVYTISGKSPHYIGTVSGSFMPRPEFSDALPLPEEGSVSVTTTNRMAMYRFCADTAADYVVSCENIGRVSLRLFDSSGTEIAVSDGLPEAIVGFRAQEGDVYYIMIDATSGMYDRELTLACTVQKDLRLLEQCTVSVEETVSSAEERLPAVAFYDGDVLLTEGVDYTLTLRSAQGRIGRAVLYYSGLGKYCGIAAVAYDVIAPTLSHIPDAAYIPMRLQTNMSLNAYRTEQYLIYHYTPGVDSIYSMTLTTIKDSVNLYDPVAFSVLRYHADGTYAETIPCRSDMAKTHDISLAAQETCYFVVRVSDLQSIPSFIPVTGAGYISLADANAHLYTEYTDPETGVVYRVREDLRYAECIGLPTGTDSVTLKEQLSCADTVYYAEGVFAALTEDDTVYGYDGCVAAEYAQQYGFLYINNSGKTADVLYDLNGDGRCSVADVILLYRVIGEGKLSVSAEQLRSMDVNSDGLVDVTDAAVLMKNLSAV